MFLAANELIKEKTRFLLIVFVIVLVSYLTFFLTSLAYGLATSYTQGIDKWNASGVVLAKDANNAIERSLLFESDYKLLMDDNTARLGVGRASIDDEQSADVALFGIDYDGFLAPNITDGRMPNSEGEVIVADDLKTSGINVDQQIELKGTSIKLRVVGFTDNATFQTAPVIYTTLPLWRQLASDIAGMSGMRDESTISALVTRSSTDSARYTGNNMEWQSIRDYSFELPGYQAQVLTFGLMIGFLIAISSFVLAVFMYILTLQKKNIFGVLKAEGVSNIYISKSVMTQIFLLTIIGLLIGFILVFLSGLLLQSKVPFLINPTFFAGVIGLFLFFGIIGGLASVRAVTKIDPVEAIG